MHDSSPSALRALGRWRRSVALAFALVTVACSADQRSTTKGMPAPAPSGFAGSWMMLEGPAQTPCVIRLSLPCSTPIEVQDEFGSLIVKLPARNLLATVNNGVLTMTEVTTAPDQDCGPLTLLKTWTGVLGPDGRVVGEWFVSVTSTTCGLPTCVSVGPFTWTTCSDAEGCEGVVCPN